MYAKNLKLLRSAYYTQFEKQNKNLMNIPKLSNDLINENSNIMRINIRNKYHAYFI